MAVLLVGAVEVVGVVGVTGMVGVVGMVGVAGMIGVVGMMEWRRCSSLSSLAKTSVWNVASELSIFSSCCCMATTVSSYVQKLLKSS